MNILLINYYVGFDYYGMEFRLYYMVREWVNMGYNVIIFVVDYFYLRKKNLKVDKDF